MSGDTVTVRKTIDAPAEEVWAALTTPETIKHYFFGSEVETDWEEGSPIVFRGEYEGRRGQGRDPGRGGREVSELHPLERNVGQA